MAVRFREVKKQLWADILAGRFAACLPPEPELAKLYSVSRMTLRRSIAELASEGFLESRPGQGTYVLGERRRRESSRTIGLLIVPEVVEAVSDPYFGTIFTALAAQLTGHGYLLTFSASADLLVPQAPAEGTGSLRRPVDGIVAASFDRDAVWALAGLRIPLVLADSAPLPERSCVVPDNRVGVAAGMRHLLALGHRRIAHIAGAPLTIAAQERSLAWREALAGAGLPVDDRLLDIGHFGVAEGYAAMARLCAAPGTPPTAVFCANDRSALGAMRFLAERGLRVPQDVSVLGFDDIMTAQYTNPPLTTIQVPSVEFASAICRVLLEDIALPLAQRGGRTVRIPTRLIERGSTAPPRA